VKLSELNKLNGEISASASGQSRTLALAGLGIVWLFAGPYFLHDEKASRPSELLFAAGGLLALSLALDLIQLYARAGLLNAAFKREQHRLQHELRKTTDPDTKNLGPALQRVTEILFYAKACPLLAGYVLVLAFFVKGSHV